jgi:protein gp37
MNALLEDLTYNPLSVLGVCPEMPDEFFSERADQSEVKALIVSQYFDIWSKVIAPNTMRSDGKLAYIDLGVSVESEEFWWRVDRLRRVGAHVRFVSLEPLLGPLTTLDFRGIHWAIAGGESGPHARPLDGDWVREIRDACVEQAVAFHFKQWGGANKKRNGRVLDDRTWDDLPRQCLAEREWAVGNSR